MLQHLLTASRRGDEDIRERYISNMILTGIITALAFLAWFFLQKWFFPEFQISSYWNLNGSFWSDVWVITLPAVIYAFFLGQLDWFSNDEHEDKTIVSENMIFKGIVSLFAGLFEELLHRGVLIYFGLIMVFLCNIFFNWIIAIILIIYYLATLEKVKPSFIGGIIFLAIFVGIWFLFRGITGNNPIHVINGFIFSIYEWLVIHKIWLYIGYAALMTIFLGITVHQLHEEKGYDMNVLEFLIRVVSFSYWTGYVLPKAVYVLGDLSIIPAGADKWTALLYLGAVLWSNAKFQEVHKYQGLAGMLNSYIFGFYMFYIAFTHGLIYAIAVHFLFDLVIFSSEHSVQVIKNWRHRYRSFVF